jgi:hypothetical protein
MKTHVTQVSGGWLLGVDYTDDGVDLVVEKKFAGSEEAANAYLPVLDADVRERYAHLFPLPIVETEEEMMI